MKHNQNKRVFMGLYAATASMMLLTGFTSLAAEKEPLSDTSRTVNVQEETVEWEFSDIVAGVQGGALKETKAAAETAQAAYQQKVEEERKAAEEAARLEAERAAAEAAAQAQAQAAEQDKRLLAALIFCEAGNQPYEGQVAVGAVVMNRVNSGVYPNSISEVIYQSGQFTPAMTGWLDSVLANGSYTDSAMQAAEDALAGSNPVGDCLYFSTGGYGMQIGDHYFH